MNSDLYKAAAKGEIEQFEKLPRGELGSIVTHKENTILHVNIIAAQTQEGESVSTKFVERILEMCPSLLLQVNAKGDAPLHAAAKCGHAAVVEALIEFAKKQPHQELESGVGSTARHMLGMKNDEEDTALHEAVQSGRFDVVKILLGADPAFPYSANGSGETPLYLAAARGHKKISAEILEKCPLAAHEGPNGKTALHAAVCSGSRGVMKLLLDRKKSLTRERDQHGWTPLHYAAYIGHDWTTLHYAAYIDPLVISFRLLKADKSAALIADEDRKMTALHLAAGKGNVGIVKQIIDHCPECCELVDDRGWNVLHFAMVSFYKSDLKDLVDENPVVKNLIFEKDVKGNTPFHVLAAVCPHPGNAGYDIVPWKIAKDENVIGMKEASQSHLVVAALIATVTFAAAFTLPGGYKSETEDGANRGTAILSKNAAFQAFVISDAIAMVLSLSAVFVHFILSLKACHCYLHHWLDLLPLGDFHVLHAMTVAFVTGTSPVLAPSVGLSVATCVLGLSFILFVLFAMFKFAYGLAQRLLGFMI
ncbi:hypothetical protein CICLE_v10004701mg [Citrus x clementina]|uniref:PGG domain-containing protein n=1 Tax=Citrus clementina TaxID=85681 RepID=V4RHA9_CITCL|nr:hypothetical protein CICLE_v10004701mg [Citrus x clementina]